MLVSELVTRTNLLLWNRLEIEDNERALNLQFLNFANLDAFQTIHNSFRLRSEAKIYLINNTGILPNGFCQSYYARDNTKLKMFQNDEHQFETERNIIALTTLTNPNYYVILDNKIYVSLGTQLFTDEIGNYIIAYVSPICKTLVETVFDSDLETNIPIYPEDMHYSLVMGAGYFANLHSFGFEQKTLIYKDFWDNAKTRIKYYYSIEK